MANHSGGFARQDFEKLNIIAQQASVEELGVLLLRYPLWQEGYLALLDGLRQQGMVAHDLYMTVCKLWPEPHILFAAYQYAIAEEDNKLQHFCMGLMLSFCKNFEEYVKSAHVMSTWAKGIGLHDLERKCRNWLANKEKFYADHYAPFLKQMLKWIQELSGV